MPQFLIHLSGMRHLGCFHILAVVNSATVNKDVQKDLLYPDLHSFGYIPVNDKAKSYCNSTFSFEEPPYCFSYWLY
jgi:hypothetical protein